MREGAPIQRGIILRASNTSNGIVTLTDGSRIEMRANTELSVDRASDGVSIRLEKGDVIVNAAKQRQGQLHVQTQDVTVSVAGTVFFVKAEEKGSQVAVIEGEVHVQQGATGKRLVRGEQVSSTPELEPLPVKDEIAWSQDVISHLALLRVPVYTLEEIKPGTVIGTVRTSNGDLAAGVRVTANRADSAGNTLRPVANVTTTDDSGQFRIENLAPGNYYLAAGRADLPTFYPGTLEIEKGTAVSVRSAAVVSAINFVVREVSIPLNAAPLRLLLDIAQTGGYLVHEEQHPDLVGEIKLILPPVDAELGRSNDQIQIITRSGPNRFTGTVTWKTRIASADSGNAVEPASQSNDQKIRRWTAVTWDVPQSSSAWWNNEKVLRDLQLSNEQRQKVDASRQPYAQLFSKNTLDLAKEEAVLKRMVAPGSNESSLVPQQEERVLQLRKAQEDAESKLNQELIQILTDAQRTQLQSVIDSQQLEARRRARILLPVQK